MKQQNIEPDDADYPPILADRLADAAPQMLYSLGDLDILRNQLLGLICSIQCPGSIVLRTFDVIRELRDRQEVLIGGFHSPMERECLDLLLRGSQPVILSPARSLNNLRIGKAARKALAEGRLLVLSSFADEVRRTTASQGILRNDMVAALAEAILVPHASKNGKTWTTVGRALGYGQKVFTFEDEANTDLIASGARVCRSNHLDDLVDEIRRIKGYFTWP